MKATVFNLVCVAGGGAVGASSRFALAVGVQRLGGWLFPAGTMVVNVLGCLAIGFLSVRLEGAAVSPHVRLGILVGLLGGFTTFSSFSLETLKLVEDRETFQVVLNVLGTVLLCLVGCWLGQRLARGFA